jgi:hypothetical protein
MKVVTTKGFATTRSTRHATERAEIEVPISTDLTLLSGTLQVRATIDERR